MSVVYIPVARLDYFPMSTLSKIIIEDECGVDLSQLMSTT